MTQFVNRGGDLERTKSCELWYVVERKVMLVTARKNDKCVSGACGSVWIRLGNMVSEECVYGRVYMGHDRHT